jgi:hypothetical protein
VARVTTVLDELVPAVRAWARRNGLNLQEATKRLVAAGLEAEQGRITVPAGERDRITLGRYQERQEAPRQMVGARLPAGLVAKLDDLARREGSTRARMIAELLAAVFDVADAEADVQARTSTSMLGTGYPPDTDAIFDALEAEARELGARPVDAARP